MIALPPYPSRGPGNDRHRAVAHSGVWNDRQASRSSATGVGYTEAERTQRDCANEAKTAKTASSSGRKVRAT
jgi:hypothetical protein